MLYKEEPSLLPQSVCLESALLVLVVYCHPLHHHCSDTACATEIHHLGVGYVSLLVAVLPSTAIIPSLSSLQV